MKRTAFALMCVLFAASAAGAQTSKFGISSSSGSGGVQLAVTTVAQLPACDVSHLGVLRVVTDAAATPVYNAAVGAGGTVVAMVVCTGTTWVKQ